MFAWSVKPVSARLLGLASIVASLLGLAVFRNSLVVGTPWAGLFVALAMLVGLMLLRSLPASQTLFMVLVYLMILADRGFAHLGVNLGPLPLWVTEAFALAIVGSLMLEMLAGDPLEMPRSPVNGLMLVFLLLGAAGLLRGLQLYGIEAIKDAALVYYALFYFIGLLLLSGAGLPKRLLWVLLGGAALSSTTFLMRGVLSLPWELQAPAQAMYLGLAALCVFGFLPYTKKWMRMPALAFAGVLGLAIAEHECRSAYIGLLIAGGAVVLLLLWQRLAIREHHVLVFLAVAVFAIVVMASLAGVPSASGILGHVRSLVAPELMSYSDSVANAGWRMNVWRDLVREIRANGTTLWLGTPLGRPFRPPSASYMAWDSVDPHNSHLTVLYRLGLVGLMTYLGLFAAAFWRAFAKMRRTTSAAQKTTLAVCMSLVIYTMAIATFTVVLEGPYMSIFVWTSLAVLVLATEASDDGFEESWGFPDRAG